MIQTKTADQLKQIAKDLFHQKIFCDRNLKRKEDIQSVFPIIALGGFKDFTPEELEDIGLIYEYFDKAAPVGCNGYPMFFSCSYLNKEDTLKIFDYYEKLKQMENSL